MSKTLDMLRSVRVFNAYEFYGRTPYVDYTPYEYRMGRGGYAAVRERGVNLTGRPLAGLHYSDRLYAQHNGGGVPRTFPPTEAGGRAKLSAIEAAIEWARETYGIAEWKRDPFGSYGPAEYIDGRIAELKKQAES